VAEDVRSEDDRGHRRSPVYPGTAAGSDRDAAVDAGAPSFVSGPPARASAERDAMVERHLGLARHLALRYSDSGEPLDDLFQVASLGLVNAVDRFDPSRGIAFTTFAVPTILGELKRHFRDRGWAIHVPRDLKEAALRVRRAIADHHGEGPPTPA
jgi:DNA-directed RNA polymerase specialized sigma subunit